MDVVSVKQIFPPSVAGQAEGRLLTDIRGGRWSMSDGVVEVAVDHDIREVNGGRTLLC